MCSIDLSTSRALHITHFVLKLSDNSGKSQLKRCGMVWVLFRFMVWKVTFNNISVISWRSVWLVEETGESGENHRQTLSHNVVSNTWTGSEPTTLVVISIDCTGSCKSNYHAITTKEAPVNIYTVRQKLSTTWLVSIICFLIMNLFQIGLLFSLSVHTS
jgi:hypothetical protein